MSNYQCKLSEIAEIKGGYQARGSIDEDLGGDFAIVRSQDCNNRGDINLNEIMRFSSFNKVNPSNYTLQEGDILVQARGQSHLAYLIDTPLKKTVAANTFYVVRIQDQSNVLPAYLAWWINQPQVQAYFEKKQGVSTIPFISKPVLSEAPIQLPPMKTQEKISKLILLWRREQELVQQLFEKKKKLIMAVALNAVAHSMEEK